MNTFNTNYIHFNDEVEKILQEGNDKKMTINRLVSYFTSINLIEHIRGGGLYVNGQSVYSYSKALKILGLDINKYF